MATGLHFSLDRSSGFVLEFTTASVRPLFFAQAIISKIKGLFLSVRRAFPKKTIQTMISLPVSAISTITFAKKFHDMIPFFLFISL
jgi:hypothetical protein